MRHSKGLAISKQKKAPFPHCSWGGKKQNDSGWRGRSQYTTGALPASPQGCFFLHSTGHTHESSVWEWNLIEGSPCCPAPAPNLHLLSGFQILFFCVMLLVLSKRRSVQMWEGGCWWIKSCFHDWCGYTRGCLTKLRAEGLKVGDSEHHEQETSGERACGVPTMCWKPVNMPWKRASLF